MEIPLDEEEIVRISCILSSDSEAVAQKEQIYGILELPLAEIEELKQKIFVENSGAYGFFNKMLRKYKSTKGSHGTVNRLIRSFTELQLTSVVEAIQTGKSALKRIWFNVARPVKSFTGRETELLKLHQLFAVTTGSTTAINQRVIAVTGLNGIGKSELARKYAWHYCDDYEGNVIWVNSEEQVSFRNSLVQLLETNFKIPEQKFKKISDQELLKEVFDWFSSQNKKCLIIFDNVGVGDFDVINLLPEVGNPESEVPNILITSTKTSWEYGIQKFPLDGLTIENAIKFVRKMVENNQAEEVILRKLVDVLQCIPLALQQAVAYMQENLSEEVNPIEKYLKLFKSKYVKDLLKFKSKEAKHEKSTFAAWTLAMDSIAVKEFGGLAIQIMQMISCFASDQIPACIFQKIEIRQTSSIPELDNNLENVKPQNDVNRAIALLKKYSLVSGSAGVILVHRILQRVVRISIGRNLESVLREGIKLLDEYIKPDTKNEYLGRALLPHAESIWRRSVKYKKLKKSMKYSDLIRQYAYIPSNICQKLLNCGRYSEMLQLARDSKSGIEIVLGKTHVESIRIQFKEAEALYWLADYSKSLTILKKIRRIAKSELGEKQEITILISRLGALNFGKQGNHLKEFKMLEKIFVIRLREFGIDNECTLAALSDKAVPLFHLGRLDESLESYKTVYDGKKRIFGEENPSTLLTKTKIAYILLKKQLFEEALDDYENIYEIQKRTIGEGDPLTFLTKEKIQFCKAKISEQETNVMKLKE